MAKDRRTPEEVEEHYIQKAIRYAKRDARLAKAKEERIALQSRQKAKRHALRDAALAKAKEERTTEKLKVKSEAHIKRWKKKLEREEDRRLKNRDERELSRIEVRESGVEERQQHARNVSAKNERDWEASREAEREKHRLGDVVVQQIEEARPENRRNARLVEK